MQTLKQDYQDQLEGLGYCNTCDKEYTDAQATDESGMERAYATDPVKYCPSCLESNKTYYACQIHLDGLIHTPKDCGGNK